MEDNFILHMDRQQSDEVHAKRCTRDKKHGKLQVHGNGSMLVCTVKDCGFATALDRKDLLEQFTKSTFIPVGDLAKAELAEV